MCRHHQCCQHSSGNRVCLLLLLSQQLEKCRETVPLNSPHSPSIHRNGWEANGFLGCKSQQSSSVCPQWYFRAVSDIAEYVVTLPFLVNGRSTNSAFSQLSPFLKGTLVSLHILTPSMLFYDYLVKSLPRFSTERWHLIVPMPDFACIVSYWVHVFTSQKYLVWERMSNISPHRKYY